MEQRIILYVNYMEGVYRTMRSEKFREISADLKYRIEKFFFDGSAEAPFFKGQKPTLRELDLEDFLFKEPRDQDEAMKSLQPTIDWIKTLVDEPIEFTLKKIRDSAMGVGYGLPRHGIRNLQVESKSNLKLRQTAIENRTNSAEEENNMESLREMFKLGTIYETGQISRVVQKWIDNLQIDLSSKLAENARRSRPMDYMSFLVRRQPISGSIVFPWKNSQEQLRWERCGT